jgi:hypothetical protein
MLELNVSNVPHATASDDGLTLTIIFDLEDGGVESSRVPQDLSGEAGNNKGKL